MITIEKREEEKVVIENSAKELIETLFNQFHQSSVIENKESEKIFSETICKMIRSAWDYNSKNLEYCIKEENQIIISKLEEINKVKIETDKKHEEVKAISFQEQSKLKEVLKNEKLYRAQLSVIESDRKSLSKDIEKQRKAELELAKRRSVFNDEKEKLEQKLQSIKDQEQQNANIIKNAKELETRLKQKSARTEKLLGENKIIKAANTDLEKRYKNVMNVNIDLESKVSNINGKLSFVTNEYNQNKLISNRMKEYIKELNKFIEVNARKLNNSILKGLVELSNQYDDI